MTARRAALLVAAIAVALLAAWQSLTVHFNYGGSWTALYCIAPHMPVPDFLRSERLYIFPGIQGYDGQVFHLIAHDPWMRRGSAAAILDPAFRYQRVLVPALAWLLALGRDAWIDPAYDFVILSFAFLGVYCSARIAQRQHLHPAFGFLFVLLPATIVSIDRMTVDIALAALIAAFVCYAADSAIWKIALLLALAGLTRETALLLIAGYAIFLLTRKRIGAAILISAAALPAIAWFVYLAARTGAHSEAPGVLGGIPFAGIVYGFRHPLVYHLSTFKNAAGVWFDRLALSGVAIMFALVIKWAIERRWDFIAPPAYAFALAFALIRPAIFWAESDGYGRQFTPLLLLLLAIPGKRSKAWLALAPIALIDARLSLNFVAQVAGVARGLAVFFSHLALKW